MDDINFDELDKAVNSVLQPKATTAQDEKPVDASDAAATNATPDDSTAQQPGNAEEKQQAVGDQPSLIMPKRRGQFMDMVHPSSDMTTSSPAPSKPSFPRRQAAMVQPLDPAIVEGGTPPTPTPAKTQDSDDSNVQVPEVAEADVVDSTETSHDDEQKTDDNRWASSDTKAAVAQAENGFSKEDDTVDHLTDTVSATADDHTAGEEPGVSQPASGNPFISGTEVEKRPLGAFTGNEKSQDEAVEVQSGLNANGPAVLPEELSPDVVSVESDDPVRNSGEDSDTDTGDQTNDGPQYIPPQYSPAKSTEDDDDHSVFDTKQYHAPLTPPAKQRKKGSVVKYVLLFIIMLLVGAAGGYIVWTLKLI